MGRHQKPFFAERIYLRDDVDLTPLLLAIVAPLGPGNPDFEEVLSELERCPRGSGRIMRTQPSRVLKTWVKDFQAGLRLSNARIRGEKWKLINQPPRSDNHFLEAMFSLFSHQTTLTGRRIGRVDCADMSVQRLAPEPSGPAPFSRTWARADARQRREMRRITYLLEEE